MEYKTANDKILWERCRKGDQGAFDELFCRHFKSMRRMASRYIVDEMQAEELVMDSFFNLWEKREQVNIDGDFLNYLFVCVYHSIVYYRRKDAHATIALEQIENKHRADCRTDSGLILGDIQELYRVALEKLTPRRRQAFLLSRHENLSYPEIAKRMNVSVSAIDNYMISALECLRSSMGSLFTFIAIVFLPQIF